MFTANVHSKMFTANAHHKYSRQNVHGKYWDIHKTLFTYESQHFGDLGEAWYAIWSGHGGGGAPKTAQIGVQKANWKKLATLFSPFWAPKPSWEPSGSHFLGFFMIF